MADPAHRLDLAIDITALLKNEATLPSGLQGQTKLVPYFRYATFNGVRVLTAPVSSGDGWTVVTPPGAPDARPATTDAKTKADKSKAAPAAAPAPVGPVLVRHTTTLPGLVGDVSLARSIMSKPVLYVFMGVVGSDSAPLAAEGGAGAKPVTPAGKAKPAATATKGAPAKGSGAPAPPAETAGSQGPAAGPSRAYTLVLPVDLSALLANAPCVSTTYGSLSAAESAVSAQAAPMPEGSTSGGTPDWDLASVLDMPGLPPQADCYEPPAFFDFLHVAVRVANCTQLQLPPPPTEAELKVKAAALAAKPATPDPKGKGAKAASPSTAKDAGKKGAAPAAESLSPAESTPVPVPVLPARLFCCTVLKALSSVLVHVSKAAGLPGIMLPQGVDKAEQQYVLPNQHALLNKEALPTWSLVRFPVFHKRTSTTFSLPDAPLPVKKPGQTLGTEGSPSEQQGAAAALASPRPIVYPPPTVLVTAARPSSSTVSFGQGVQPSRARAGGSHATTSADSNRPNPYAPPKQENLLPKPGCVSAIVCLGLLDNSEKVALREALQSEPLLVELHDRDSLAYEEVQRIAQSQAMAHCTTLPSASSTDASSAPSFTESVSQFLPLLVPPAWAWPVHTLPAHRLDTYEAVLMGAAPMPTVMDADGRPVRPPSPPPPSGPPSPTPSTASKGAPPAAAKGGKAPAAAAPVAAPPVVDAVLYPNGADVFALDELFTAECVHRAMTARDRHAHGVGRMRLDGLLDTSAEKSNELLLRAAGGRDERQQWMPSASLVKEGGMQPLPPLPPPVTLPVSVSTSAAVPLLPAARYLQPKIAEPLHLLSRGQLRCVAPGAYGESGATIKVSVTLAHSPTLFSPAGAPADGEAGSPEPLFERVVVMFDYYDDRTLHSILDIVASVNTAAMPHSAAPGDTYRTYQLSSQEAQEADAGKLNILTGAHVLDGLRRIVILEGLPSTMERVRTALPRTDFNSVNWTLLANPAMKFHARLYTAYGLLPKELHLRHKLEELVSLPTLYKPRSTPAHLRDAVVSLGNLANARTLAEARLTMGEEAWPTVEGLEALDRSYGGTVTLADVYGASDPATFAVAQAQKRKEEAEGIADEHLPATVQHEQLLAVTLKKERMTEEQIREAEAAAAESARHRSEAERYGQRHARKGTPLGQSFKDATMSYTRSLSESAAVRASKDYLTMNKEEVEAASRRAGAERKSAELYDLSASLGHDRASLAATLRSQGHTLDTVGKEPPSGQIFMYSQQSMNTGEWAKELQRQRLAQDKNATYTRSANPEFGQLSMGISLVPEAQHGWKLNDHKVSKQGQKLWKTAQGWTEKRGQHSAVEDNKEAFVVPMPSGWRKEEVNIPYHDPMTERAKQMAAERTSTAGPGGRPAFHGDPVPNPLTGQRDLFGYVEPQTGKQEWRALEETVHQSLQSSVMIDQYRKAAKDAKHTWQERLLVEDPFFHTYKSHDGAGALPGAGNAAGRFYRYQSMREDAPHKRTFSATRSRSTGRIVPAPGPAPTSMFALDEIPYGGPPMDLHASLRTGGAAVPLVGGIDQRTGRPIDFTTRLRPSDTVRTVNGGKVYNPLIDAAVRGKHGEPGQRPVIPTHAHGINTDRR